MQAGLPNITGSLVLEPGPNPKVDGAFYFIGGASNDAGVPSGSSDTKIGFNASRSNDIYGASQTVQPPSIVLIPQIKI